MRAREGWMESLPRIGGVVIAAGLFVLIAVGVVMVSSAAQSWGQQSATATIQAIKPHLRGWMGWVMSGFTAICGGLVLYWAGTTQRRGVA